MVKKHDANVRNDISLTDFQEGDSYSKQYKVVEKKDDYIIIAKTFKNGNPKVMTKKVILVGDSAKG